MPHTREEGQAHTREFWQRGVGLAAACRGFQGHADKQAAQQITPWEWQLLLHTAAQCSNPTYFCPSSTSYRALSSLIGTREHLLILLFWCYKALTSPSDVCVNWNRLRICEIFYNNKNYIYFISIITMKITRKKEFCNFFSEQIESCWNLLFMNTFNTNQSWASGKKESKGRV